FFQAEDGIRDFHVTGVQTCALPISDGDAGEAGELQGEEGEGQADWEKVRNFPGAEVKNDRNILLPDGMNVNRHDSTRPFNNGPRSEERRVGKECRGRWSR